MSESKIVKFITGHGRLCLKRQCHEIQISDPLKRKKSLTVPFKLAETVLRTFSHSRRQNRVIKPDLGILGGEGGAVQLHLQDIREEAEAGQGRHTGPSTPGTSHNLPGTATSLTNPR